MNPQKFRSCFSMSPCVMKMKLQHSVPKPSDVLNAVAQQNFTLTHTNISMSHFDFYCKHQNDSNPMYLFDSIKLSLEHPACLGEDVFEAIRDRETFPTEWYLKGPRGSGSTWHLDPYGCSAWNFLSRGEKLWLMCPE